MNSYDNMESKQIMGSGAIQTPASAATSRVLALPELLEIIFLYLDVRLILTSTQRVCKLWKGVIDSSGSIQQQLFFEPIPAAQVKMNDNNQVIFHRNPHLPKSVRALIQYSTKCHNQGLMTELNAKAHAWRNLPLANTKTNLIKHLAWARKGASWRRMLLSQPPPRVGYIDCESDYSCVELQEPLRLGTFFDICYSIVWDPYCDREENSSLGSGYIYWLCDSPVYPHWKFTSRKGFDESLEMAAVDFVIQDMGVADLEKGVIKVVEPWMFRCAEYKQFRGLTSTNQFVFER
jgi:hypothetical protein